MKAIVFENNDGVKNFIVFDSAEKLFEVFRKICEGTGCVLCLSEEQFENLKSEHDYVLQAEIIFKNFLGIGAYDYNGNLHNHVYQSEGRYYIEDYSEITENATTTNVKLEFVFLN